MSHDPSGFTFTYKVSALEVELKYMYVKKKKKKGYDFGKHYEGSLKKKQKMQLSYDCNPTLGHISGEKNMVKRIHVSQCLLQHCL